jgi:serine/threonine-protein kinase
MADTAKPATMPPSLAKKNLSADGDWSGRTLGEFQILRRIGRGGMGQVFLAEQKSLKRKVALKILRPELAADEKALKRFQAEAEAVARLTHANIVQVYSIGEQDGIHYMALEHVDGRNLKDYLSRKGPPDLPVCISIMRQIAAALQRASELGFVHRDVKPENILVARKGEVKVADFGLTRCLSGDQQPLSLTQSGIAMGTPLYMSPEQVQGYPVDPRSDIYSFGVSCFHMLVGEPPFRGSSAFDVAIKHVQCEPPQLSTIRPDLPPELCAIVHKMMAKFPSERYQACKDIIRDLNRVRDSISSAATVPQVLPIGPAGASSSGTVTAPVAQTAFDGLPTAAYFAEPPSHRWGPRVILGIVLIVCIAAGIAVRVMKERLNAKEKEPARPTSSSSVVENQPVASGEERFLLDATRQFADPNPDNVQELKRGLGFQVDLAVYYLKKSRWDDAEKFFQSLAEQHLKPLPGHAEHPYHYLARLGQALLLSNRDKAEESLQQLAALVPGRSGASNPALAVIKDNFEFMRLLAEAINRDLKNLKVDRLPEKAAHLEAYRRPDARLPSRPAFKDWPKKG